MKKIGTFKITGLKLSGFKSFSEPTELTFGDPTVITGGNGRGKSSIADAISFVVTGLPFFGERRIDRLHSEDNPELFVAMSFVDEDGASHELSRTRKSGRMTISYDGYELRQLDLTEMFGERDVFLSIFNPLYFIEELGDDGKNLLQRYLPEIPQEQAVEQLSAATQTLLGDKELVSPEGKIKRLREEVREFDNSVIYLQGQMDLTEQQSRNGDKVRHELTEKLHGLQSERDALEHKRYENMDADAMRERLLELSAQYSELSSDSHTPNQRVTELQQKIAERRAAVYEPKYTKAVAETTERVRTLGEQYKKERNIYAAIGRDRRCPTCHRAVLDTDIPTLKSEFEASLGKIVADGKEQQAQLQELRAMEQKAKDTFEQFKADDVAKLEAELAEANNAPNDDAGHSRIEEMRAEIQSLTSDIQYGNLTDAEYERLIACGEEIRQVEAELAAQQKTAAASVEDYSEKISGIQTQIKERKAQIDALFQFLSKRAELTFSQLKMNRVAISLYDVVKSTGEVKDTFKFTYNDRRYDRLSLSEKIRAGMEVSELMKKLTGRNYPVFVDNMESVDDLANVKPTGQVIMAKCVNGAALTVRPVKPILTQMEQAA